MFRNLLTITKLSPGLIFHPDPLPARTCNSKLPPAADPLFCLKTQLGSVAGVAAEECEDACFCSGANVLDQILHSIQANALHYRVYMNDKLLYWEPQNSLVNSMTFDSLPCNIVPLLLT